MPPMDGQEHPLSRARSKIQEAERLRLSGKLDRAESVCAAVLREYPDYLAALQTMGLTLADRSQYERAAGYLHRALMLSPKDPKILTALSGVYLGLDANLIAARTLEQALPLSPNDPAILATLGEIYRDEKEYELSIKAFEAALRVDPHFTGAEIGLVLNMMQIGQLSEAAEILQAKVRQGSRSVQVLHMLSELPASLIDVDLISALDEAGKMQEKAGEEFRSQLAFSKAAAFDKAARYEEALAHLLDARRFKFTENKKNYQKLRELNKFLLDRARSSRVQVRPAASEYPISLFIVGPSRSGKTSLERLVGLMPGVKRGYENPIVENSVRSAFQTAGFPTRQLLNEMPPLLGDLFRKFYSEELAERAGGARVLTNTLPARTEDALRVASEIPNARFIFIKRNVDDISIRIFMRSYKSGHSYASDLRDIREYISFCHTMMEEAAEKMPTISRVLAYEDMVKAPGAALAQAAELCNIETSGSNLPSIGDDRGCAAPYQKFMAGALNPSG